MPSRSARCDWWPLLFGVACSGTNLFFACWLCISSFLRCLFLRAVAMGLNVFVPVWTDLHAQKKSLASNAFSPAIFFKNKPQFLLSACPQLQNVAAVLTPILSTMPNFIQFGNAASPVRDVGDDLGPGTDVWFSVLVILVGDG